MHLVEVEKKDAASGGGPYSQGAGVWGELGPGGWLGCGVAGGSPRSVGHPEGYPEPGGAARPGRFAVAPRAWHPRRNPGTGEPARPTEGSPRPPGGAVADAVDQAAAGGTETAPDLRKHVIQITRRNPYSRWTRTPK
ncbi:hypothetical protein SALBM311S_11633 [Streptomyces alboniger]